MSDSDKPGGGKTIAFGPVEKLIVPKLEPGKACFIVIKGRSVGRLYELGSMPMAIGRAAEVELCIDDPGVSRRHAEVLPGPDGFAVRDLGSTNGLFVNGERVTRHLLHDGDRVQIGTTTILKFCFQDALEESVQKRLYESATRDCLVGTFNRQYFVDSLETEIAYCARHGMPLSVLMLDIDHFKAVNDTYGHLAGDHALKEVAAAVQMNLRAEDILARIGGEEFAVLLRRADLGRAEAVAERIRAHVEAQSLVWEGQRFTITVSIGIAAPDTGAPTVRSLLQEADEHLYEAKERGRNRVVSSTTAVGRPEPSPEPSPSDTAETGTTQRVRPEDIPSKFDPSR